MLRAQVLQCAFAIFLLNLSISGRSLADEKAEAILDRAIKAHGGAKELDKTKVGVVKYKTIVARPASDLEFVVEETFRLPGLYKRTVHATFEGKLRPVLSFALKDGKGWIRREEGKAEPFTSKTEYTLEGSWQGIFVLLPQMREKDYELTVGEKKKIRGKEVSGVVAVKGDMGVILYFDPESGLLSKTEKTVTLKGKQVLAEVFYEDYKKVQGINYSTKITVLTDGTKFLEIAQIEVKFLDKIDDREFKKPE